MLMVKKVKSNDDVFTNTSKVIKHLIESGRTELQKSAKLNFDVLSLTEITEDAKDSTELKLVPADLIEAALKDVEEGFDVLVVNPCDDQQACGEWDIGKDGVEENIAYCSTLSASLVDDAFPIKVNEMIYSPEVYIFRDALFRVVKSRRVAILSVPPMKRPDFSIENDLMKVTNKIEAMWLCAIANRHTSIVMSTFGCDTHDNDPVEIAKIVKKMYETYKTSTVRRVTIVFSKEVNDPNLLTFKKQLSNCY